MPLPRPRLAVTRLFPIDLLHDWAIRLPVALGLTGLWAALSRLLGGLGDIYADLFRADTVLVVMVLTLMLLDAVTGIAAARKRRERIRSRVFRRTGYKLIEYAAVGAVGVLIANGFGGSPLGGLTQQVDDVVLFYLAVTEAFSVFENVTGSREGAVRLVRRIRNVWHLQDGTVTIEETVRQLDKDETITPPAPTDS